MPRKTNPNSKLGIKVQLEVLDQISIRPKTTRQLELALNRPYGTVRQAIKELEDTGQIIIANHKDRGSSYKLSDGTIPSNRLMPTINANKNSFKLTQFLSSRHTPIEGLAAVKAVVNIPMYVTKIMKAAQGIHSGNLSKKLSLPITRMAMEKDLQGLENAVSIYKQILGNEKIWNPHTLGKFPMDTDWDENEVNAAFTHYFPNG